MADNVRSVTSEDIDYHFKITEIEKLVANVTATLLAHTIPNDEEIIGAVEVAWKIVARVSGEFAQRKEEWVLLELRRRRGY